MRSVKVYSNGRFVKIQHEPKHNPVAILATCNGAGRGEMVGLGADQCDRVARALMRAAVELRKHNPLMNKPTEKHRKAKETK